MTAMVIAVVINDVIAIVVVMITMVSGPAIRSRIP